MSSQPSSLYLPLFLSIFHPSDGTNVTLIGCRYQQLPDNSRTWRAHPGHGRSRSFLISTLLVIKVVGFLTGAMPVASSDTIPNAHMHALTLNTSRHSAMLSMDHSCHDVALFGCLMNQMMNPK